MARKVQDYKIFGNHAYYTPGISGMIALFGWFILGSVIGSILAALLVPIGMSDYAFMISYVVSFIPAMMFVASRGVRNAGFDTGYVLDNNNFAPVKGWVLAVMVILGTLSMSYIADFFTTLLPPMPDFLKEMMEKLIQDSPIWVSFITVSLMAPFFEEWLCRGVVLRGLLHFKHTVRVSTPTEEEALAGVKPGDVVTRHGLKPVWAIVISALFFAVLHMNPWQGIAAFLLGCLFGYVYWKTGSLKLTMLMHFTNNTFALILANCFPEYADAESIMDILPVWQYAIGAVLCIAILVVFFCVFRKVQIRDIHGNSDPIEATLPE